MTTRTRLMLALATTISMTVAGPVFGGGAGGAPGATPGPAPAQGAPAQADPVAAAVAKVTAVAEEAASLKDMRIGIQDKLREARNWVVAFLPSRPGSDANDAAKSKWDAEHAQGKALVDSLVAVAKKFDTETYPAFVTKMNEAKAGVDAAKKMTTEQTAAVKDAKARVEAALGVIRKLQTSNVTESRVRLDPPALKSK